MFIGRDSELKLLNKYKDNYQAKLISLMGRRRIGKSTLIEKFAEGFKSFVEIQGLGPDQNSSKKGQLHHFSTRISQIFDSPRIIFEDWSDAFFELIKRTKRGEHLIFLDEISWMGKGDPLFAAKLKEAWDIGFKKNPKNTMVICGSVSSWIEENILNSANFAGRISLQLFLNELNLKEINFFWDTNNFYMGDFEKMIILSIAGGVPKYLEELVKSETVDQNIIRLCYTPSGILFNEYDKIFHETLGRKSKTLEKIINACLVEKLSPKQLADKLKIQQNQDLTNYIHILELSGFLSRDYSFKFDGTASKISYLRVKDNYIRFYLKYIAPMKEKIEKGGKEFQSLSDIRGYQSILGLQFENLILANRQLIHLFLDINPRDVISSAPYVQRKTTTNKGACQVDLLIHTQFDLFYLCEMKCMKRIGPAIMKEVKKKMETLKLPKRSSLRPILIYVGELDPNCQEEIVQFFHRTISLSDLLT